MNKPLTKEIWELLEAANTDEEWDRICAAHGVTATIAGSTVVELDPSVPPPVSLFDQLAADGN